MISAAAVATLLLARTNATGGSGHDADAAAAPLPAAVAAGVLAVVLLTSALAVCTGSGPLARALRAAKSKYLTGQQASTPGNGAAPAANAFQGGDGSAHDALNEDSTRSQLDSTGPPTSVNVHVDLETPVILPPSSLTSAFDDPRDKASVRKYLTLVGSQPGAPRTLPPHLIPGPSDGSLQALVAYVHSVIGITGGRMGFDRYVVDATQPIRMGLCSVQCVCHTKFGKVVDAVFFASRDDWACHTRTLRLKVLRDNPIDIVDVFEESMHEDEELRLTFRRPCCVIMEAVRPVQEVLRDMRPFSRSFTVTAMADQLAAQLVKLHGRKHVHCAITSSNVIQIPNRSTVSWTFREYACCKIEGFEITTSVFDAHVRLLSPEAGQDMQARRPIPASPAMDVWQLGLLLYELYTSKLYWPAEMADHEVLTALCTPGSLPHERDPSILNQLVQAEKNLLDLEALVTRMLNRDPAKRPTMAEIGAKYSKWAAHETAADGTVTWFKQPIVVLTRR